MAERPNLDEDKGGKLIDPTRFRGMDADYQDVMTHGEVPLAGSIFALDIGLFSGHQKAGKSTDISIRKLEYMLLSGCCAQILCEEKLLSFISWRQKYNWLTFLRSITERALRHTTPHCLELTNVTRDSDRIYRMRSNGHTVADSIGERSKRPTTYKFKTDCSIIPVWKSVVSWSWMKVILWNAEKEYVVHQGAVFLHVIIDPHGIRGYVTDQIVYRLILVSEVIKKVFHSKLPHILRNQCSSSNSKSYNDLEKTTSSKLFKDSNRY
ncbi:hypothetical protein Tco_0373834 [Tanacetum coccineum]|uniref:Uncharacterized protein n=1 Tax=Tanacetum coccineum TaxID=301880 RepID=A0ABQ4YNR2_9ASTR